MWKKIEICHKTFFITCSISDGAGKCMLTNLNDYWGEAITTIALMERAKELNKRIKYDESTVCQTLQQQEIDKVELTTPATLKLKYRVKSYFFNFEWRLGKLTDNELKEAIVQPLLTAVHGLTKQIQELRETVIKKDVEVGQYKVEGAILRRTTVATRPFDLNAFNEKYIGINACCNGLVEMAAHSMDVFKEANVAANERNFKQEIEQPITPQQQKTVTTPRHRKRKALEIQKSIRQQKLQTSTHKLEFEGSQTLSQESLENSPVAFGTSETINASTTVIKEEPTDSPKTNTTFATNDSPVSDVVLKLEKVERSESSVCTEPVTNIEITPNTSTVSTTLANGEHVDPSTSAAIMGFEEAYRRLREFTDSISWI